MSNRTEGKLLLQRLAATEDMKSTEYTPFLVLVGLGRSWLKTAGERPMLMIAREPQIWPAVQPLKQRACSTERSTRT